MKKVVIILFVLFSLLLTTNLYSQTMEKMDEIVKKLTDYIEKSIPDSPEVTVSVEPFLMDTGSESIFGKRLKSLIELALTNHYRETRVVESYKKAPSYSIMGETQVYLDTLRIVMRITSPDGSIIGGTYVDEKIDPAMRSLIFPVETAGPEEIRPETDQFEPDDNPGFEVEIESKGEQSFQRVITEGDVDRFIFQLDEKEIVSFKVITSANLQFLLFNETDDFPIATKDRPDENGDITLEIELEKGVYIAEVSGFTPYTTGNYKFIASFTANENDTFEPDNEINSASSINLGETQSRILVKDDRDWVRMEGKLPGFYTLTCKGNGKMGLALYVLRNKNEQPELIAKSTIEENEISYTGFFIGNYPVVANFYPEGNSGLPIRYQLKLEKMNPTRVYPDGGIVKARIEDRPLYFILRILNTDTYKLKAKGNSRGKEIRLSAELFNLPRMGRVEGKYTYFLESGDYLLKLSSESSDTDIEFCISREADDSCSGM